MSHPDDQDEDRSSDLSDILWDADAAAAFYDEGRPLVRVGGPS